MDAKPFHSSAQASHSTLDDQSMVCLVSHLLEVINKNINKPMRRYGYFLELTCTSLCSEVNTKLCQLDSK